MFRAAPAPVGGLVGVCVPGNRIRALVSRLRAGGDGSEVPTAPVAASCSCNMLIALTFSRLKPELTALAEA